MPESDSTVVYAQVDGYHGYRVGNDGTVQSCKNTRGDFSNEWRNLKPGKGLNGYLYVVLSDGKVRKNKNIHRLVAEAFIGPRPEGMDCCHNNGIRTDNRSMNLRYDTRKGNLADCVKHGTTNRGSRCGKAKLTDEQILEIRSCHSCGEMSRKDLAVKYGVDRSHISRIINRDIWSHL